MNILVGDVFSQELLDEHGDIGHRFPGYLLQLACGYDLALFFGLGGSDLCHDGQYYSGVTHNGKTIDSSHFVSCAVEHAVILAPLHVPVCELLFHRAGHLLGLHDVVRLSQVCAFGTGNISGYSDQTAQIAEHQCQVALSAGSSLSFSHDLSYGIPGKVRYFAISYDLLGYESDELVSVLQGVVHAVSHVNLISVAFYARPQGRMHSLYRIQISGCDHDEVARDGLGSDQGTRAALALAGDGILAFLQSCKQALLRFRAQGVCLIDEEHTFMGSMNSTAFHALMRGRLQAAGLEGVMPDIAKQGSGVRSCGIDVGRLLLVVVVNQQLRNHSILFGQHIAQGDE